MKYVKDLFCAEILPLSINDNLSKVFKLFKTTKRNGFAVVDQNNKVVGVVTQGDLVLKLGAASPIIKLWLHGMFVDEKELQKEQVKIKELKVNSIMSKPAITVTLNTVVDEVVKIMHQSKIKQLPVIDEENKYLGMIEQIDIIKSIPD